MAEVDLQKHLRVVWKWLWLAVLCVGISVAAAYYASQSMPRVYRTSVTLLVGENIANPNVSFDEVNISQRVAGGYLGMVRRQPILEATVKTLGLPTDWHELQRRVLASRGETQQLLEIRVVDTDPERVRDTANEIARQLILQSPTAESERQVEERRQFVTRQLDTLRTNIEQTEATVAERRAVLEKETSARGVMDLQDEIRGLETKLGNWRTTYASLLNSEQRKGPATLSLIEPAFLPIDPISPNLRANILMAAAVGAGLALAAAFALEYLTGAVTTAAEVTRAIDLPIFGSIPRIGHRARKQGLVAVADPYSPVAEAYRVVRANVQFASANDGPLALLVTSPALGEGKSFTSANLAVAFAQSGRRTILVDADLRHPTIHTHFGVENNEGLGSILLDRDAGQGEGATEDAVPASELRRQIEARLVATSIPNLSVLPSGPPIANPAEMLASPRMEQILRLLQGLADVVLVDSPPVLAVADTPILAAHGPAVLLVARPGKTRGHLARLAVETLARAHAQTIGVILNMASSEAPGANSSYWRNGQGPVSVPARILRALPWR